MDSWEDIPYLLTCCGKTHYEGNKRYKYRIQYYTGLKVWERLQELRSPPIRYPLVDATLDNKDVTIEEILSRREVCLSETLGVVEQAPRTYLDMVLTKPGRNLRILIKIIDGFKCDIWFHFLTIYESNRIKLPTDHSSRLESYCYKELFEYYDMDNPINFLIKHKYDRDPDGKGYETFPPYEFLWKSSWYHKSIVKSFNNEIDNLASNNDEYGKSFKHCLNFSNAKIMDLQTGRMDKNVEECDDLDLVEKLKFGLTTALLIMSDAVELRIYERPFKSR